VVAKLVLEGHDGQSHCTQFVVNDSHRMQLDNQANSDEVFESLTLPNLELWSMLCMRTFYKGFGGGVGGVGLVVSSAQLAGRLSCGYVPIG